MTAFTSRFLARLTMLFMLASPFMVLAPIYVEASTPSTPIGSGSFDASSLLVESGERPRITGTADVAKVRVIITATSTDKKIFKSNRVKVKGDTWSVSVRKRLPDGTYNVTLYQDNRGKLTSLATSTLMVGVTPVTLKVLPIALLGGGTTKAGSTVPISYLQVLNMSDATTTIAGFTVKQNGTAPVKAVIGLSSVDDKGNYRMSVGGIEGQAPFSGSQAYVPSGAVIGPKQMKLFTLKAQLSSGAGQYAGTNLMLDIAGVDAQASFLTAFPVRGTTWLISS